MNKGNVLVFALIVIIIFTGCNNARTTEGNSVSSTSQLEAPETETEEIDTQETTPKLKEIVDNTEWQKPVAKSIEDAPNAEFICEDETYEYYFEYPFCEQIYVRYEDGSEEGIREALTSGRIDIYDMKEAGIGCFVREKNPKEGASPSIMNIVDEQLGVMPATEMFYEDENYGYYFSNTISFQVFVYYSDGTRLAVDDALIAGKATLEDLKAYDIHYTRRAKIDKVVDLTKSGEIECVQEREYLCNSWSHRYYFDCVKSMYIEIYYENGDVETLKESLESGRISYIDLENMDMNSQMDFEVHCEEIEE